jgi:hypothetical protein
MILLLAFLFGVESQCPEDVSRVGMRVAMESAHTQFTASESVDMAAVRHQLGCVQQILLPEDAVWLHGLVAREKAAAGDIAGVTLSMLAARSVPLSGPPPAWLQAMNMAVPNPAPWSPVSTPEGIALFVDGAPAVARPLDRPAIYQAMGPGAVVLWTKVLSGDEDLPPGFILEGPPPMVEAGSVADEIAKVKDDLLDGKYDAVLQAAIVLSVKYPESAETFRSLAAIASDQAARRDAEAGIAEDVLVSRLRDKSQRWPYRKDDRKGILVGFEVGTPSSVRLEWKIAGQVVDSIGLRVGVGAQINYIGSADATTRFTPIIEPVLVDFNVARQWQLQTSLGVSFISASPRPILGLAAQWDPDSPIEVTVGASIGPYVSIAPRASVGFMW